MYALGIDLGTTFTAAATWRDGRATVVPLGSRGGVIPSVVLLGTDGEIVTGEAAARRAMTEPERVAREFKRRLGDTTPVMLGGTPYPAEALVARLLRTVFDDVTAREGQPPAAVCVTYPANWGEFKTEVLRQAVHLAGLDTALAGPGGRQPKVTLISEPEAAAVCYARQQRTAPGSVVAVYDLGGGTFDATVLRKTADDFELLGHPEGIEHLGGVDFDAAVFGHVVQALGPAFDELDEDDPAALAAVARLRRDCTEAKEALSADTSTTIAVMLPNAGTEIRLTRHELEQMIRPALADSVEALRRALTAAEVDVADLHSVLLVGGSSRIPLVGQLVAQELGRPVAVDAHPKHVVALGAAWAAGRGLTTSGPAVANPLPQPAPNRTPNPGVDPVVGPVISPVFNLAPESIPAASIARTAERAPLPVTAADDATIVLSAQDPRPTQLMGVPSRHRTAGVRPTPGARRFAVAAAVALLMAAGAAAAVAAAGGSDDGERPPAQQTTTQPTGQATLPTGEASEPTQTQTATTSPTKRKKSTRTRTRTGTTTRTTQASPTPTDVDTVTPTPTDTPSATPTSSPQASQEAGTGDQTSGLAAPSLNPSGQAGGDQSGEAAAQASSTL